MPTVKGQVYNTEPKPKIREVFEKVVKNGKPMSVAVKEVYKNKSNQTTIKKSKSWQQLLSQTIPEKLVAHKHLQLLNKEEVVVKNNVTTGEIDVIPTGQIDVQAVSKGLDMYYKIAGKYPKEGNNTAIQVNIGNKIDETRETYSHD